MILFTLLICARKTLTWRVNLILNHFAHYHDWWVFLLHYFTPPGRIDMLCVVIYLFELLRNYTERDFDGLVKIWTDI